MFAVIATVGTVATVFGVTRSPDTARRLWADAIDALLRTTHKGHATADSGYGYTCIFEGEEIVATVKIEECKEY